jgi:hypothetical protein
MADDTCFSAAAVDVIGRGLGKVRAAQGVTWDSRDLDANSHISEPQPSSPVSAKTSAEGITPPKDLAAPPSVVTAHSSNPGDGLDLSHTVLDCRFLAQHEKLTRWL